MSLTCNICDELSGDELSVRRIERRRIERDELIGDELISHRTNRFSKMLYLLQVLVLSFEP